VRGGAAGAARPGKDASTATPTQAPDREAAPTSTATDAASARERAVVSADLLAPRVDAAAPAAPTPPDPSATAPPPAAGSIPDDVDLGYDTLPPGFWDDPGAAPSDDAAGLPGAVEDEPDATAHTDEPLQRAFAEMQRLFPGRVIEVLAPPPGSAAGLDEATADDALDHERDGDLAADEDDATPDDHQPGISFLPGTDRR